VARLDRETLGMPSPMQEDGREKPDYVPPWWERGRYGEANHRFDRSPTRVLAFYAVIFLVSIALIVRAILDPHAAMHGYRGPGSLVAAVILIPLIAFYAPRAWAARQRERR
jgi:hypothetical protein